MIIGTLKGDEGGDGKVFFAKQFLEIYPMYRADVLQDCLYDLLREYNKARVELGWGEIELTDSARPADEANP